MDFSSFVNKGLTDVYVPNYNNRKIMRNPVNNDLGNMRVIPDDLRVDANNLIYDIPGSNTENEQELENGYKPTEYFLKLSHGFLYLPVSADMKIILRAYCMSRAQDRKMVLIMPKCAMKKDRKCFFDINVYNGTEPDPHGKAFLLIYSLICGCLGCYNPSEGAGISISNFVDTPAEYNKKAREYATKVSNLKKAGLPTGDVPIPNDIETQIRNLEDIYREPGMKVGGDLSNPNCFTCEYRGMPPVEIDRYHITIQNVDDICYAVHITLIDPRIDLAYGIHRTIEDNRIEMEKITSIQKHQKGNMNATYKASDMYFNTRSLNGFKQITSNAEYINNLKILAGQIDFNPFELSTATSSISTINDIIDPVNVLSPTKMFKKDMNGNIPFKFAVGVRCDYKASSQEAFVVRFVDQYIDRSFPVRFTNINNFNPDILGNERLFDPDEALPDLIDETVEGTDLNSLLKLFGVGNTITIYSKPETFFRLPIECINSIRCNCHILPDKLASPYIDLLEKVLPNKNNPYPVQPDSVRVRCHQKMEQVVCNIIEASDEFSEIVYDCDTISYDLFGRLPSPNFSDNLSTLYRKHQDTINAFRLNYILPRAWDCLTESNYKIPSLLRVIMKDLKLKTDEEGRCFSFVDLYNTRLSNTPGNNGFTYYENLTPTGNFFANHIQHLKENDDVIQNFHCYNLILLVQTLQMHLHLNIVQLLVLLTGEFSGGKSYVYKLMGKYFYEDTYTMEFSTSQKAWEYGGNMSGKMIIVDDTSDKKHALLLQETHRYEGGRITIIDNNERTDATASEDTMKVMQSEGYFQRSVTSSVGTGNKDQTKLSAAPILSIRRCTSLVISNQCVAWLKGANMSRALHQYSKKKDVLNKKMRKEKLTRSEIIEEEDDDYTPLPSTSSITGYHDVIRSLQSFTAIWQFLEACGAIPNTDDINVMIRIYFHRFKQTLQKLYPLKIDMATRFEEDQLPLLIKGMRLIRIWSNICSNAYDDPDLKASAPFSIKTIEKLIHINAHFVTEEDFFHCVSFMGNMLPPIEEVAVIDWMIREVERHGCRIRDDVKRVDPAKFRPKIANDIQRNTTGFNITGGTVSTFTMAPPYNASSSSSSTPSTQSTPSMGFGTRSYLHGNRPMHRHFPSTLCEHNNTHLATCMDARFRGNYETMFESVIRSEIASNIKDEYYYLDNNTIYEGLYTLAQKPYKVRSLKFKNVGNEVILEEEPDKEIDVYPVTFSKADDSNKYSLTISVAWLNHMIKEYGCFRTRTSYTSQYQKCSVIENVFAHMGYKGCDKYDILLLGEFLDHNVDKQDTNDLSSFMKVLNWGEPMVESGTSSTNTFLDPDIAVPANITTRNESIECIFDYQGDTLETARYTKSVIAQYEKGYKNDEGVIITKNLDISDEVFKEDVMNVCEKFNPSSVRTHFRDSMPTHKKQGLIYPHSIIPQRQSRDQTLEAPRKRVRYISLTRKPPSTSQATNDDDSG